MSILGRIREEDKGPSMADAVKVLVNIYVILKEINSKLSDNVTRHTESSGSLDLKAFQGTPKNRPITYFCGSADNFRKKVAAYAENLRAIRREEFTARELSSFLRKEFAIPFESPIYYTNLLNDSFLSKAGITKASRNVYQILPKQ